LDVQYAGQRILDSTSCRKGTQRMKSTDVAVIKFTSENGRELTGVVAKVTEKGLAVLGFATNSLLKNTARTETLI